MARQNTTIAATVATFPVLSVGFVMPTPGVYTLFNIYARTRALVSALAEGVAKTQIPWKISKMTAEITTNLDFLAPAYKKMAEIIAQLLKKV